MSAHGQICFLRLTKQVLLFQNLMSDIFTRLHTLLAGNIIIPHGLANAVLMPYILEGYGKAVYKKLHKLAIVAGISTKEESSKTGAEKFIAAIKNLNKQMNIPTSFEVIDEKDISKMAKYAAKEANPLYPVPQLMNAKELEKFYYQVRGKNNGTK